MGMRRKGSDADDQPKLLEVDASMTGTIMAGQRLQAGWATDWIYPNRHQDL